MSRVFVLILFFFLGFSGSVACATEGQITSEVFVSSRDSTAEQQGLDQAMIEALRMMTGNAKVADSQVGKQLRRKINTYLLAYRYEQQANQDRWKLIVDFDQRALVMRLDEAGIATRRVVEKAVLLWLAWQPAGQAEAFIAESGPELPRDLLAQAAKKQGYRAVFPLMDLEDIRKVSISDLRAGFSTSVAQAAERYGISQWLSGWIAQQDESWEVTLNRLKKNSSQQSQGVANTLLDAIQQAFQGLTASESETLAVNSKTAVGSKLVIRVNYVQGYNDYKRMLNYLSGLSSAGKWRVVSNQGSQVVLQGQLQLSESEWLEELQRGGVLERVGKPVDEPQSGIQYYFYLE